MGNYIHRHLDRSTHTARLFDPEHRVVRLDIKCCRLQLIVSLQKRRCLLAETFCNRSEGLQHKRRVKHVLSLEVFANKLQWRPHHKHALCCIPYTSGEAAAPITAKQTCRFVPPHRGSRSTQTGSYKDENNACLIVIPLQETTLDMISSPMNCTINTICRYSFKAASVRAAARAALPSQERARRGRRSSP